MAKQASPSFENSLTKLSELVQRIDSGELELAEALKSFEEGIQLIRHCQQALTEAEQKIQVLTEENAEINVSPLIDNNDSLAEDDTL